MGFNMVERLSKKDYELFVYDSSFETNSELQEKVKNLGSKIHAIKSLENLVQSLDPNFPKTIWLMVPHAVVDDVLNELKKFLKPGDTIIDGGNSPYKESMRRAEELKNLQINYLDVGVSGGPDGAKNGVCLMIGGEKSIYEKYVQLFSDIAAPDAFAYLGKSGAGHFTKMIHNGIEYGMMQSLAEGFGILKASQFDLNLLDVAKIYNNKSVIESRLVAWLQNAFLTEGQNLELISPTVEGTGEGLWTVQTGQELGISTPAISAAVDFRNQSKTNPSFVGKVVSALRNQFGGHKVK